MSVDPRKFHEVTLTRGAQRDVVLFGLPVLPHRLKLHAQMMQARGFTPEDIEKIRTEGSSTPSAPANGDDIVAIQWATLGLCWRGSEKLQADFVQLERNAVKYGETVLTELYDFGFDVETLTNAGKELYEWMIEATWPSDGTGVLEQVKQQASFTDPSTVPETGEGR